ncbi:MAG: hypothetical protein JXM70_30830 [Pirellulales bacterium]|nr:hypothetical protein [Pirellulales bacterium]
MTNDVWRAMLSVSIDRAVKRHSYSLIAFVFMPDHIHMLVFDEARLWRWSSCRWYIEGDQCREEVLPTVEGCPAEFWDNA